MRSSAAQLVGTRPAALAALGRSLDDVADRVAGGEVLDIGIPDVDVAPEDEDVAGIIAAADRLVAAVRRSHALEAAVHELFEAMSSHLRLDYLGCEALYRVMDHTQATGGAVVLVGEGPPDVVASVEFDLEGEELAAVTTAAFVSRCPTQLEPLGDARPLVAVPFVGDSGPLGAVLLSGVLMDREMLRLLALLARALGFAVSNALAHAAAEIRAATDPLTGCKNRRAGLEELAQAARLAAHGGPAIGALMIDLDHFKRINDRYGHQVGDDVLRAVGGAVSDALRGRDVVMRYGGEEFLAAVTGADEPTMQAVAERVSDRIRALAVPDRAGGTVALTTSVGIALWTAEDSAESLIGRADRGLYAAKAGGRDRAVLGR
jgi:two-component system cell cycle response regulator